MLALSLIPMILVINIVTASGLQPLFKVSAGIRDVGGCDQDLPRLQESYREAIDMAKGAIAALSQLRTARPHKDKDPTSLSQTDMREAIDFMRIARLAYAMFKIEFTVDGVQPGDSTKRLEDAIGRLAVTALESFLKIDIRV